MKNCKKVVMWAIIADLLLLGVLFVLCGVADRQRNYDGLQTQKNSTYNENNTSKKSTSNDIYSGSVGKDINTNLTMEDGTTGLIQKSEVFGRDIYDRAVIPSGEAMGIYMKTDGVMVVDVCSFKNLEGNTCCPADGSSPIRFGMNCSIPLPVKPPLRQAGKATNRSCWQLSGRS